MRGGGPQLRDRERRGGHGDDPGAEHREQAADDPAGQPPGGQHGGQAGQRGQAERARGGQHILAAYRNGDGRQWPWLDGHHPGPALPDREKHDRGAQRAEQQGGQVLAPG